MSISARLRRASLKLASLARPSGSEVWLQVCHCQLGKTAVVVVVLNSSTIVVVAGYRSATAKTAAVVLVVVVVVVVAVVVLVLLSNCSSSSCSRSCHCQDRRNPQYKGACVAV